MSKQTTSLQIYMDIKMDDFNCIKLYHFNSGM